MQKHCLILFKNVIKIMLRNERGLLQWQLQHPKTGARDCYEDGAGDVIFSIEYDVEKQIFGDNEVGTYVIYLSEIRRDVDLILQEMELNK